MKRSGTSEADFRTAATKKACRQYRAVWWFLLPEDELRLRQVDLTGRQQIANPAQQSTLSDQTRDIKRNELVPHGNNSH